MSIEITPALLADLRQKSGAATPGEWLIGHVGMAGDNFAVIISRFCGNEICVKSYAEFIAAANPSVVLALIDEIKRLNERYDEQKLLATRMIEHAAEQKKEIDRLNDKLDELICSGCNQQPKFCNCELVPLSGNETDFASKGVNNANQA